MTNHFDQAAQNWDSNPIHNERTKAIAAEMIHSIPLRDDMKALEFGSGTGLLSFALKDHLLEIVLMDNSIEMNKQSVAKIEAIGLSHFTPIHFDLEKDDYGKGSFDIIFTQMALHHVKDVTALIGKFYNLLNVGGYIAIADLYAEDGTFHDSNFDGHYGFEPDFMIETLTKVGFTQTILKSCFEINRPENDDKQKVFPVFLVVAKKP
ncbi:MAG: class I SAM-dependent methyltransferase [Bacteroidota bacterium]